MPTRRALLALVAALAFVLPLVVVLSTRIPATAERRLVDPTPLDTPLPVELPRAAVQSLSGVTFVHRMRLETRNVEQVVGRSEIRLLVATHSTSPSLDDGEVAIGGTDCSFRTVRGAAFRNNDYLTFRRGPGCLPLRGTPTGELRLTLRFSTPGRAALWTYAPWPGVPISHDAIVVSDSALPQSSARPVVRGVLVDTYPSNNARRIDLLAYVWQVAASPAWIWLAVAAGGLLIGAAAFSLSALAAADQTRGAGLPHAATAAFCGCAALALMYAVLVPPFQAADEPNHFVTFAALVGRANLATDAAEWAELSHFERIQFHPDERFGPMDRERRGAKWDDGIAQDIARGAGIAWLWRPASLLVSRLPAARVLLALRLINVLVFAATGVCYVVLVVYLTRTRAPELWMVPLFLVPTLPFFASYVSNYSLLVDAYIVLAAGIVVSSTRGPRGAAAGPIVAAAWVLAALVSRSALPLAPAIGALFAARLVIADGPRPVASAAIFWGGVGIFSILGLAAADQTYLRRISDVGNQQLPSLASAVIRSVIDHPWLALLPAAAAAALEVATVAAIRKIPRVAVERCQRAAVLLAGAVAIALAAALVMSFVRTPLSLAPVDPQHPPPVSEYARAATYAGLTMFRFGRPDLLMSLTFWGGFGWLDTLLPDALVALLAGATGLAFVALFAWIARRGSVRLLVLVICLIAGYAASLAAYAASVISTTPADLHGRYLIGLYLLMVTVAWTALPRAVEAGWINRRLTAAAIYIASVAVHLYSLSMILQRYF